MTTGSVRALFLKPAKGAEMLATTTADLLAGKGLAGDANADERSPRQVLLVDEETVQRLDLAPGALRENVCVGGLPVDQIPSGTALRVGTAALRVTFPCDPCALLRRYAGVTPAQVIGARGMLAVVASDGAAAVHDPVVDLGGRYPALPTDWHARVVWFLQRLPADSVMTYGDLAAAVGQAPSVARVLPRLLAGPRYAGLAVDRVLTAAELAAANDVRRWSYWDSLYEPLPRLPIS